MNREIKFRVWVRPLNEMHDQEEIKLIDFERNEIHFVWWMNKFDECEIMQYTGLKDKNGKEIYEGDLISIVMKDGTLHSPKAIRSEMEFNCGCCSYVYGWEMPDDFSPTSKRVVVVGNIYENPELLK